jgi:hypothetical protein
MSLALVAGQLGTKHANWMFVVGRGAYERLPLLTLIVVVLGVAIPLAAIFALGRRIK